MSGGEREVVGELFSRIDAGDPEGALALIDAGARWSPTMWSSGGTLEGRGEVREWFAQFGSRLEHLRIDVARLAGEGGWIVVLGTVRDLRGDGEFAVQVGWTFAVEDGLVVEGRAHQSWDEALAAAGLAEGS